MPSTLVVREAGDRFEREADRMAETVLAASEVGVRAEQPSLRRGSTGVAGSDDAVPRVGGAALDAGARQFFEGRFGFDFEGVRVFSGPAASASARALNARAYTVGSNIVFGDGEYAPASKAGARLLAHELTHVVQQTGRDGQDVGDGVGIGRAAETPVISHVADRSIQRTSPALAEQSLAEHDVDPASPLICPVNCGGEQVGLLTVAPLFPHFNRQAVSLSDKAVGIGAMVHFSKSKNCDCDAYDIIQVVTTNFPPEGRSASGFVDNIGKGTPFYRTAGGKSGTGTHQIPKGFPGQGSQVTSEVSIYDMASNVPPDSKAANGPLLWRAETRVVCVRNTAPDRILEGVSWGFRRETDTNASGQIVWKEAVKPIERTSLGPISAGSPFARVLSTDPTVSGYQFE